MIIINFELIAVYNPAAWSCGLLSSDLTVALDFGAPLTWGTSYFLSNGSALIFGSPSATNDVIFMNPLDLAGTNQTILVTPNGENTNQAILKGVLSNGSLTIGDATHSGSLTLAANNTYVGTTKINNGQVILTGTLQSLTVNIAPLAIFNLIGNDRLSRIAQVKVDGTLNLSAYDQTIDILFGKGSIMANNFSINNGGTFTGDINASHSFNVMGATLNLDNASLNTFLLNVNTGAKLGISKGLVSADTIYTGLNSIIKIADSSNLNYNLLTGLGTVNTLGFGFVNQGTITGFMNFTDDLINLGTISPGFSPGLITIQGDYYEGGNLVLDILGNTAITAYDQVHITGTPTLLSGSNFDVYTNSSQLAPRLFYQVLATNTGGPINVAGILGNIRLFIDGIRSNTSAIVFDSGTGRIYTTGILPITTHDPGDPYGRHRFFQLGSNANQRRAAKAIFSTAFIGPNQINTNTLEGKLALQILQGNHNKILNFYTPIYYGSMADYAFIGERALANRVLNRVSIFSSLPGSYCCKVFPFAGNQRQYVRLHGSDLTRNDFYLGMNYTSCHGFSVGTVISPRSSGNINASMGRSDADGNGGLIYLKNDFGSFKVATTIGGSFQSHGLHRPTANGYVQAKSRSKSITSNLGIQYTGWQPFKYLSISPRVNVVYSHAWVRQFKERGAVDALHNSGFCARLLSGEFDISLLSSFKLWKRPLAIETTLGIDQPLAQDEKRMNIYVINSPNINYSLIFTNNNRTEFKGNLNLGYQIHKSATLYGEYQATSGERWNHSVNFGFQICFQP